VVIIIVIVGCVGAIRRRNRRREERESTDRQGNTEDVDPVPGYDLPAYEERLPKGHVCDARGPKGPKV
jgi:hypothetical protein